MKVEARIPINKLAALGLSYNRNQSPCYNLIMLDEFKAIIYAVRKVQRDKKLNLLYQDLAVSLGFANYNHYVDMLKSQDLWDRNNKQFSSYRFKDNVEGNSSRRSGYIQYKKKKRT